MINLKNTNQQKYLQAFVFAILVFVFLQLINFNGLYGQDGHEYFRYTKHLKESIINNTTAIDYFWPIMYPLIASLISFTKISALVVLQLISIFSYVFSAFFLLKIIRIYYCKNALWFVIIFFLLSPFVFRFGSVVMSDMLCLLFLLIGLYQLLLYDKTVRFNKIVYAVLFFSLSFHTRYISVLLFLIPFLYVFVKHFKRHFFYKYLLLVVIALLVSVPHIYIKSASLSTFNHSWLVNWSFSNFFKNEFITTDGIQSFTLPNLLFVLTQYFHPRYFFVGVFLLFFIKIKDFKTIFLLTLIPYLFFLSGISFQNTRFFILTFPFFLLVLFPSFNRLMDRFKKNKLAIIGLLIFVQVGLLVFSFSKVYQLNQTEKKNVTQINKLSDKEVIYTSGYEGPLRSYSDKQVLGLYLDSIDTFEKGLFMINELDMKRYQSASTLKYNYLKLNNNYTLQKIKSFDKGWILYEIR